jgi:hypothetical protein
MTFTEFKIKEIRDSLSSFRKVDNTINMNLEDVEFLLEVISSYQGQILAFKRAEGHIERSINKVNESLDTYINKIND